MAQSRVLSPMTWYIAMTKSFLVSHKLNELLVPLWIVPFPQEANSIQPPAAIFAYPPFSGFGSACSHPLMQSSIHAIVGLDIASAVFPFVFEQRREHGVPDLIQRLHP